MSTEGLKPFTSEHQPKDRRSRKGVPNRSTVLKKWLFAQINVTNPITNEKEKGTPYDEVMLALIAKAQSGDVPAIKEIQDTLYGKLTDRIEILTLRERAETAVEQMINETGVDRATAIELLKPHIPQISELLH